MPLDYGKFAPLRTWAHQSGDQYDLDSSPWTIGGYRSRYAGRDKDPRTNVQPPAQHPNVHGDAIVPSPDDMAALSKEVKDAFASLGFAPGEYPTQEEWSDMDHFIEQANYPGYASGDLPVLYRIHYAWLRQTTGITEPEPLPEPEPHPWTQPPFSTEHFFSQHMANGTARNVVGNIEVAWNGCNAIAGMAVMEGVLPGYDDPLVLALAEARGVRTDDLDSGLLPLLKKGLDSPQGNYDPIVPTPDEEALFQRRCDAFWDAVGDIEKRALSMEPKKYSFPAAGYTAPCDITESHFYRCIGATLSAMSAAAGSLSLQGRLLPNGQRDAWYVDPFQSWENQDPWYLASKNTGGGGFHVPGS